MGIYLELASLVWFLICWLGYSLYSQHAADKRPCLSNTLDLYRTDWMRVMLSRENRISDASVVGNLERNGAFFASSCLLILAGIITALGYTQQVMEVFSTMPFGTLPSRPVFEMRMILLMVIFIYAFFKFTWSMRTYNFLAVLIGAAPLAGDTKASPAARDAFARSAATVCNQAGDAFNLGLRSYYYALAVVAWFVHPVAFIGASTLIVIILYRREFRSDALVALRAGKVFEDSVARADTEKGKTSD
jgi:uncharacterized membrane protein